MVRGLDFKIQSTTMVPVWTTGTIVAAAAAISITMVVLSYLCKVPSVGAFLIFEDNNELVQ